MSLTEAVRQRPAMYVGNINDKGAHEALFPLCRNLLAIGCVNAVEWDVTSISSGRLSFHLDEFSIPSDIAEMIPQDDWITASYTWRIPTLNALSRQFQISILSDEDTETKINYVRGIREDDPQLDFEITATQISLEYDLDESILNLTHGVSPQMVIHVLKELSHLVPACAFEVTYELDGRKSKVLLRSESGLEEMLSEILTVEYPVLNDGLRFEFEDKVDDISFQIAGNISSNPNNPAYTRSWANLERTIEDGAHVDAVINGITLAFKRFCLESDLFEVHSVSEEEIREHLQLLVHVTGPTVRYVGAIRSKIDVSPKYIRMTELVERVVYEKLSSDLKKGVELSRNFT